MFVYVSYFDSERVLSQDIRLPNGHLSFHRTDVMAGSKNITIRKKKKYQVLNDSGAAMNKKIERTYTGSDSRCSSSYFLIR